MGYGNTRHFHPLILRAPIVEKIGQQCPKNELAFAATLQVMLNLRSTNKPLPPHIL